MCTQQANKIYHYAFYAITQLYFCRKSFNLFCLQISFVLFVVVVGNMAERKTGRRGNLELVGKTDTFRIGTV